MNESFIRRAALLAKDYPILYVDDEQSNLIVFNAEFGDEFSILLAPSAEEGLQILQHERVAVLLADQRMPQMTGVELCERVRERYPHVLRILVTAYSDQRTAIDAINLGGVVRYLAKPWAIDDVRQVLREAVARAHLEQTVRQLRAAILEGERLAAVAATQARLLHDLANPLSAVTNTTRILGGHIEQLRRGGAAPALLDEIVEEVGDLQTAADYISNLYDSALARLVPRAGTRTILGVAEVTGLVAQLLQTGRAGAPALLVDCPDDLTVWANLTDVSRILMNLVTNASQAIDGAGVERGEIHIVAAGEGEHVVIEVRDNGPGVAEELQERIFDLSYTSREAQGGSGLGLTICRDLAQANDGEIVLVDAAPGGGATFRLTLPARRGAGRVPSDG